MNKFPGIYTHNLAEAHLVVPRKVNTFGEHLSHNLNHRHNHNHYNDATGDAEDHKVHYHIDLHNETLHLELE
jgi:hypothetical protein